MWSKIKICNFKLNQPNTTHVDQIPRPWPVSYQQGCIKEQIVLIMRNQRYHGDFINSKEKQTTKLKGTSGGEVSAD